MSDENMRYKTRSFIMAHTLIKLSQRSIESIFDKTLTVLLKFADEKRD